MLPNCVKALAQSLGCRSSRLASCLKAPLLPQAVTVHGSLILKVVRDSSVHLGKS